MELADIPEHPPGHIMHEMLQFSEENTEETLKDLVGELFLCNNRIYGNDKLHLCFVYASQAKFRFDRKDLDGTAFVLGIPYIINF